MALKYAIVDIETTGNNLDVDEIIQIGVCIMHQHQIIDSFETFIKTNQNIPLFIQSLTKINNNMLVHAPTFDDIAKQLFELLEGCVFVAHNVDFDLNFVQKYFNACNIEYRPKYIIDTVDIFKIVYPTMTRYQLSYIAEQLGVNLKNAHRAIDDAFATAEILNLALAKLINLPINTLKQLYQHAKQLRYDFDEVLFDVIRNYSGTALNYRTEKGISYITKHYQFNSSQIEESFESYFNQTIKKLGFNYRSEQFDLSLSILQQLYDSDGLTIEAELGSGKTLSYLLAAIYYIRNEKKSVLISTSTIALQNQMIEYDLAMLNEHIDEIIPFQLIKSKQHYLSIEFVDFILKDKRINHDIIILRMQLLIYLLDENEGDIELINLNGGRKIYFELMRNLYNHSKHETYLIQNDLTFPHIGITNHAHLLSDRTYNVFKRYESVIIDEAHQILNYALKYTTTEIKYQEIKYLISQTIQEFDNEASQPSKQRLSDLSYYQYGSIHSELNLLNEKYEHLFDLILSQYYNAGEVRFNVRTEDEITVLVKELKHTLEQILEAKVTTHSQSRLVEHLLDYFIQFDQAITKFGELFIQFNNANKSGITIIVKNEKIKSIMKQQIQDVFNNTIYISGTINSINEQNILSDLFTSNHKYLKYEASFEKFKAPLYIPTDIMRYQHQHAGEYIEQCMEYILHYLNEIEGKVLILVNSYQQIEFIRDYLYDTTLDQVILTQNSDANTVKLNQQFNQLDKGVLLATQTFYEGIDFKGAGIKCVMVISLPFMHPKDINLTLMQDEVHDVFTEYQIPVAVNKLHQATGRLIRNEQDKGVMICFDRRIIESNYANKFKHILNHFDTIQGNFNEYIQFIDDIKKRFHN